jgi:hypothetical protein
VANAMGSSDLMVSVSLREHGPSHWAGGTCSEVLTVCWAGLCWGQHNCLWWVTSVACLQDYQPPSMPAAAESTRVYPLQPLPFPHTSVHARAHLHSHILCNATPTVSHTNTTHR